MILIVDDDHELAENCSMLLESYGYEVDVAFDGKEALAKITHQQPDLLISDCCMPELTGLQLSEHLRDKPGDIRLPILLMSGSLQCDVAAGDGYDSFIRKPFLAEHLLAEVRKLLCESPPSSPEEARKSR